MKTIDTPEFLELAKTAMQESGFYEVAAKLWFEWDGDLSGCLGSDRPNTPYLAGNFERWLAQELSDEGARRGDTSLEEAAND